MDHKCVSEFSDLIQDHLKQSQRMWIETGSRTAATPGTSAKLAFKGMPNDYLDAIEDLNDKIWGRFSITA